MPVSQVKWRLGESECGRHKSPEFNIKSSFGAWNAGRRGREGGYTGPRFLKFIFCCIYSLSFKFFRLRVVSFSSRLYDLSSLPPPHSLSCASYLFLSLSLRASVFRVIWTVASALRYVGFFVVLVREDFRRCLPHPGFIKYRALRNIYWICWLFGLLAENLRENLAAHAPGQLKRRGS